MVGWGEGVGCVVAMDGVGQGNVTACNKNDEIRVELLNKGNLANRYD